MKSVICVAFLLTVSVIFSNAATGRGFFEDPNYPGKCAIKEDLILSPGEDVEHPDFCGRISCQENSFAIFVSCGTYGYPEGCSAGEVLNPELPYPKCCERKVTCN